MDTINKIIESENRLEILSLLKDFLTLLKNKPILKISQSSDNSKYDYQIKNINNKIDYLNFSNDLTSNQVQKNITKVKI